MRTVRRGHRCGTVFNIYLGFLYQSLACDQKIFERMMSRDVIVVRGIAPTIVDALTRVCEKVASACNIAGGTVIPEQIHCQSIRSEPGAHSLIPVLSCGCLASCPSPRARTATRREHLKKGLARDLHEQRPSLLGCCDERRSSHFTLASQHKIASCHTRRPGLPCLLLLHH